MAGEKDKMSQWIPTFGKEVKLGMLYDSCTGRIMHNESLYSPSWIEKKKQTVDYTSTDKPFIEISADHSLKEKAKMLEMNPGIQINYLTGLIDPCKDTKILDHKIFSSKTQQQILHYKKTTRLESIPLQIVQTDLETALSPHFEATHVVLGMLYAAHVFIVLDTKPDVNTEIDLEIIARYIKGDVQKEEIENFNDIDKFIDIHCYCNTQTPISVSSVSEAASIWNEMGELIPKTGGVVTPSNIFITPLSQLNKKKSTQYFVIDPTICKIIVQMFHCFDYIICKCNEFTGTSICSKFPDLLQEIRYFKEMIKRYSMLVRKKLAILIPAVRRENTTVEKLLSFFREKEISPFTTGNLVTWVMKKQAEIESLSTYIKECEQLESNYLEWEDDELYQILNLNIEEKIMIQISRNNGEGLLDSMRGYLDLHPTDEAASSEETQDQSVDNSKPGNPIKSKEEQKNGQFLYRPTEETVNEYKYDVSVVITTQKKHVFAMEGNTSNQMQNTEKQSEQGSSTDSEKALSTLQNEGEEKQPCENLNAGQSGRLSEPKNVYEFGLTYEDHHKPMSDFLFQPAVPSVIDIFNDHVLLQLPNDNSNISSYNIQYKEIGKSTIIVDDCKPGSIAKIAGLKSCTYYDFSIIAKSGNCKSISSEQTRPVLTKPTGPPEKPTVKIISMFKATLKWSEPDKADAHVVITNYKILQNISEIKSDSSSTSNFQHWIEIQSVEYGQKETEINIEPNIGYKFKIVPCCFLYGDSVCSEESEQIFVKATPAEIMKARYIQKSKLIEENNKRKFYEVPKVEIYNDSINRIKKCEIGSPSLSPEKVIMVVGATGAGKSTMINGMMNYVLGVEYEDSFRFKLINDATGGKTDQSRSQTSWITSYTIYHQEGFTVPYTLTILDTPGYGDTEGIKQDQKITKQITKFFNTPGEKGIDQLHAVGFVVQAALPRLTGTQKYIFDSILALFGKDLEENIFMLITFADANKPPVLSSLKKAELPWKNYFKFNNSALFPCDIDDDEETDLNEETDENEEIDKMFWKMWKSSFKNFLKKLQAAPTKSLLLTKDVLSEREQLEIIIQSIQVEINQGLNMRENLQKEEKVLNDHKSEIQRNENFTYEVEEEVLKLVELEEGEHVTNCLTCNRTCHFPCYIADDEKKMNCKAMRNGKCQVCEDNCSWDLHKNNQHKYEIVRETVTKTSAELKKKYEDARGKKLTAEELISKVKDDFEAVQIHVLLLTEKSRASIERLKEIAMKPSPLSTPDYIDILIQTERSEKKDGWTNRIEQLTEVRKNAETMIKVSDKAYQPLGPMEHRVPYETKIEDAKKKKKGGLWKKVINFFESAFKRKEKDTSEDTSWYLMPVGPYGVMY